MTTMDEQAEPAGPAAPGFARKRDLVFDHSGAMLETALGIPEARSDELDKWVVGLLDGGASPSQIVEAMNGRGDLTDAEWTCTAYFLGWYTAGI